jgi:hypothetical protein
MHDPMGYALIAAGATCYLASIAVAFLQHRKGN